MRNINNELCYAMHKFVSEHLDDMTHKSWACGYEDDNDMLQSVRSNVEDAIWALDELCRWGMRDDYAKQYFIVDMIIDNGVELDIFKIQDRDGNNRYFKLDYVKESIVEVQKVTKLVQVDCWE